MFSCLLTTKLSAGMFPRGEGFNPALVATDRALYHPGRPGSGPGRRAAAPPRDLGRTGAGADHAHPGDPDLRDQIERAVTRLCADLGVTGSLGRLLGVLGPVRVLRPAASFAAPRAAPSQLPAVAGRGARRPPERRAWPGRPRPPALAAGGAAGPGGRGGMGVPDAAICRTT